jgi:type IV pilus assembly protein PilY1
MKTNLQALISVVALHGLMVCTLAHATNLAERPLRAAVLAKPNVIFGMDDSGSMDNELMLYNNDGALWWDFNTASGWGVDASHPNAAMRTITSTWFNGPGDSNPRWRKMVYLFPNGTGTGDRSSPDAADAHFAVMPTTQFAFTRWSGVYWDAGANAYRSAPTSPQASPVHNPIYYNPLTTYSPWAPAQTGSGAVTPAAATAAAARSHPIYGSGTLNLTADVAANQNDNHVFTALPGMVVPVGASVSLCDSENANCGGWNTVTTQYTVPANTVTRVALGYYAATYWVKESCSVPSTVNVLTDTCTTAPDGSTLKRYEIKSTTTSYPSGRSYAQEMQNFANWWQYHRKRRLMLAGAMGSTLENLTGLRMGVVAFNSRSPVTMYDADSTNASANRLRVAGIFYETTANGGTPTRETLDYIRGQYARTSATNGSYDVMQYACQRNNAFIVTDGFANASAVTMPNYDAGKSQATYGSGAPYENIDSGTLADLSLRMYTNNIRTDLTPGRVLTNARDPNPDPHINTYGLSIGARGTLFIDENSAPPTTTGLWPNPTANRSPYSVDDLWHATINGRGKMYLATTPTDTALRIQSGLNDILQISGAQGGASVGSVNLARGDGRVYLGSYNVSGWVGDLTANGIDVSTANVSGTAIWSAANLLAARNWTTRNIFTSSGNTGQEFTDTNIGATVTPSGYVSADVVNYLRGDRSGEGTSFRTRSSLMGPVVNSTPVVAGAEGVVYVATGYGMLHAFDTATGVEQWAYVPQEVLSKVGEQVRRGWTYQTLTDATPRYGQLSNGNKLLVAGLGAAGRSYYAMDVSAPKNLNQAQAAAQFRWRFPASTDTTNLARMGYTVGQPSIVRTAASGDVVLVTSGYDNGDTSIGDGKGRMWMLNAATGAVIKTFSTTSGSNGAEAGLAHLAPFRENDGTVRYVYGGDLLGNLWRFDLATAGAGEHNGDLVASFIDANNNPQPITATPELGYEAGKRIVMVGTGRLLDISDFGSALTQTFYALADGATLTNARSSLVARTFDGSNNTVTGASFSWANNRGFYMDLPAGEQANTKPLLARGMIAFSTNVQGANDCVQSSYAYLLGFDDGLPVPGAALVRTTLSLTENATGLQALQLSGGRIRGDCRLSNGQQCGVNPPPPLPIPPAKGAWKDVRRR